MDVSDFEQLAFYDTSENKQAVDVAYKYTTAAGNLKLANLTYRFAYNPVLQEWTHELANFGKNYSELMEGSGIDEEQVLNAIRVEFRMAFEEKEVLHDKVFHLLQKSKIQAEPIRSVFWEDNHKSFCDIECRCIETGAHVDIHLKKYHKDFQFPGFPKGVRLGKKGKFVPLRKGFFVSSFKITLNETGIQHYFLGNENNVPESIDNLVRCLREESEIRLKLLAELDELTVE